MIARLHRSPATAVGSVLVAFVVIAHGGSLARADDRPAPAPIRFMSLAPDGARSEINVELATGSVEPDDSLIDATSLHLEAQYVATRGAGGYVRLGIVSTSSRPFGSDTGFAGTEAGGFQRIRVARGATITGRLGVALPTSSDYSRSWFGAQYVLEARRPADLPWISLDDAMLRLAVTPTYSWGPLSARIDAGLDASLAQSTDLGDSSYHMDLAVGVQRCAAGATIELSTFGYVDGGPYRLFRRHALTIGAHYQLRGVLVSARIGSPFTTGEFPDLPPGYRSDVGLGDHLALALGLSVGL